MQFISVFNQLDAQNLFHCKFYFMHLHVSSTCAHHQEVKIALHSLSVLRSLLLVTHYAYHSQTHPQQSMLTQHDMLPQHPVNP
jgi:hypothetical protein